MFEAPVIACIYAVSLQLRTSLFNLLAEKIGEFDVRIAAEKVFWR